jgi:Tol biopolymer transport system component
LGDSADQPRYIETLPRRGYRFIAPVGNGFSSKLTLAEAPASQSEDSSADPASIASVFDPAANPSPNLSQLKGASHAKWFGIAAAAVVILAVVAYTLRPTLPPPRITGYTQLTHDGLAKTFAGQAQAIVLTDGSRIYVQENLDGRYIVGQVSVAGGDTVPMAMPFPNVALSNISSDKSELVVGSFSSAETLQTIWAVPALGGSPRRLVEQLGSDAVWMPNGDRLLARNNELLEISSSGDQRRLASLPIGYFVFWLRWSPDGKVLRFTVDTPIGDSIWEMAPDGSHLHQLFTDWQGRKEVGDGNWTPDGKYFVFWIVLSNRNDLWAVREKGDFWHKVNHEPVQLTSGPLNLESPQPSADGKKIFAVGSQPRAELVRYDAKSGQFVPYLGGISASAVSFSRDGKWVAYVSWPETDLWRCRVDGSEKLQLTSKPMFVESADWSPDGSQIAYTALELGAREHVYLVPATAGVSRKVTVGGNRLIEIGWAPDGNTIYLSDNSMGPEELTVHSVDVKTLKETTIPDSHGLINTTVSPDGRYLAATKVDGQKLMIFDTDSQRWSEVAQFSVSAITWSRDSNYVYFDTQSSAEPAIYRLRISDHKLETVVSLKNLRRTTLPTGTWMGLTPEGDPLLMRDTSTPEVYALDFEEP